MTFLGVSDSVEESVTGKKDHPIRMCARLHKCALMYDNGLNAPVGAVGGSKFHEPRPER
jgi:hypothetical protein